MNWEKIKSEIEVAKDMTDMSHESGIGGDKDRVYDSSLNNVNGYFETVMPEGTPGIKPYLKKYYSEKLGKLIGIELGGPGVNLFKDLKPYFERTAGFTSYEDPTLKHDSTHEIIEADVFSRRKNDPEKIDGYQKIEAWVENNGKADLLIERMVAGVAHINIDLFKMVLKRWYKLLSSEGTMLIQFPALDGGQQLMLMSKLNIFLSHHRDKFDYDFKDDPFSKDPPFFVLRLRKLEGAPDSIDEILNQ